MPAFRSVLILLFILGIGILAECPPCRADFKAFLRIDEELGDSTNEGYSGWVDIRSYRHPISQANVASGPGSGAGKAEHGTFVVTKILDRTSPRLALLLNQGKHVREIRLDWVRAGSAGLLVQRYILTDVLISSIQVSGSVDQDSPVEEVAFTYGRIQWEHTRRIPVTNVPLGLFITYWDLVANRGSDVPQIDTPTPTPTLISETSPTPESPNATPTMASTPEPAVPTPTPRPTRRVRFTQNRFTVFVPGIPDLEAVRVEGLELETQLDSVDGDFDVQYRRWSPGMTAIHPVSLYRVYDPRRQDLFDWYANVVDGLHDRRIVTVGLVSPTDEVLLEYRHLDCRPLHYTLVEFGRTDGKVWEKMTFQPAFVEFASISRPAPSTPTPQPSVTPSVPPVPTATPEPTAPPTATPSFTATPTFTPVPQPLFTPTRTPAPLSLPVLVKSFKINEADAAGNLLSLDPLTLGDPSKMLGLVTFAAVPRDLTQRYSDGRGARITLRPQQMAYISALEPVPVQEDALLRISIRTTSVDVSVSLIALDGSKDGSISLRSPAKAYPFLNRWGRLVLLARSDSSARSLIPAFQVVNTSPVRNAVVFLDNFEVFSAVGDVLLRPVFMR